MQRMSAILPSWDKTKSGSKKGFDKVWGWADKLGAPINRLTNRIGSEAFWPTTLDKESDKAARILRSFCKDGFYVPDDRPNANTLEGPNAKSKQRVLKKIPQKVIQNAVGLAIFTTMRTGLWISGAGGSGVLIARKEDGTWSPPSGILLHTAGLGFLVGVDIYDCVVVINNRKALEAFTKIRATLGGEISAVAGPVGMGGVLEHDGKYKEMNRPVFTYLKSRGFYAGVQVDGTVIIERTDENEKFYGERIGVADILAGKARHPPYEIKMLMETVKAAEGRTDVDKSLLAELDGQPAPGDVDIELTSPAQTGPIFGVPEPDDPDPFGVLALENAGLEIREAGTGTRPVSSQFEFHPSPTSPLFSKFNRRSIDTLATSNRGSYTSNRTFTSERATQMVEMGTQTDFDGSETPVSNSSRSLRNSLRNGNGNGYHAKIVEEDHQVLVREPEEIDYTKIDLGPYSTMNHANGSQDFDGSGTTATNRSGDSRESQDQHDHGNSPSKHHEHDEEPHHPRPSSEYDSTHPQDNHDNDSDEGAEDEEEEEPVIFEVAAVQTSQQHLSAAKTINLKARGSLVDIPKRIPPPLPPRSSARNSARTSKLMMDAGTGTSPTREISEGGGFETVTLDGPTRVTSYAEGSLVRSVEGTDYTSHHVSRDSFSVRDSIRSIERAQTPRLAVNDSEARPGSPLKEVTARESVENSRVDDVETEKKSQDAETKEKAEEVVEPATVVPSVGAMMMRERDGDESDNENENENEKFQSLPSTPPLEREHNNIGTGVSVQS